MKRIFAAFVPVLLMLPRGLPARAQDPRPPDPNEIAKRGSESLKKYESSCASWIARHEMPNGSVISVQAEIAKKFRRRDVEIRAANGPSQRLCQIIERDGLWYVTDIESSGKYRPYEAPLSFSLTYLFLERSEPRFIVDPAAFSEARFESQKDGEGTWRAPYPEAQKRQLEANLRGLEDLIRKDPDRPEAAKIREAIARTRERIEKGHKFTVVLATGLLKEIETPQMRTEIADFKWRDSIEDSRFSIGDQKWLDHTSDPTAGDMADYIMIANDPAWRPGGPKSDMSPCLLNLKSKRYRRVPCEGVNVQGGCFSLDRKKVYITMQRHEGVLGLAEIDLKTGKNRDLATNLGQIGNLLFPELSPDGRTVALLHQGVSDHPLKSRLTLVDVQTGKARYFGDPIDAFSLSWWPDGKSLILVERTYRDLKDQPEQRITRIDLEGGKTFLRNGNFPRLSPDGKTLLYQDEETWKTVALEGGEPSNLGDGFRGHGFPTFSPDGTRIIMMRFQKGAPPIPVIIELKSAKVTEIYLTGGAWAYPVWK